jgi:hypothetical protein
MSTGVVLAQDSLRTTEADTSLIILHGDTTSEQVVPSLSHRSPMGALLRSAIVPGWGQLYNRKYIKALVVAAGETFVVAQSAYYWDLTDQAYERYARQEDLSLRSYYYADYIFYKDRRNLYLWISGLTVFLSMIDAYVDAHLANFDVDVTPPFEAHSDDAIKVSLIYRF